MKTIIGYRIDIEKNKITKVEIAEFFLPCFQNGLFYSYYYFAMSEEIAIEFLTKKNKEIIAECQEKIRIHSNIIAMEN